MSPAKKAKARKTKPADDGYIDTAGQVIGLGGTGNHGEIGECPLCWAHGGGGHGAGCPNATIELPAEWLTELPDGWTGPDRPAG
jgi:hypothetical protein